MALGINWDEEDARYNPPKVEKSIVQETKVDAAGDGAVAPSVLKDTVPAAAVGQAAVPPAVSTSTATGNPVPPSVPSWVTNAANAGGNALGMMAPIVNPFHYKANGEVDPYATGAHAATDLAAGYTGLKVIQGVGSGISRRISNVIGGVDPTIQAQINQSDKQAARAASQPQGKMPDPIATPRGRIEPTMAPEPLAPPAPPEVPKPPVTPAEKAALAAAEPSPYEQERHRLAKIKADKAQFEFDRIQQKANAPTAAAPAVLPEAGRTLEQTAALGKSLPSSPVTPPVSPTTPVVTPLPIETTPVTTQTTPKLVTITATPEITGEAGTAVKPKLTRVVGEAKIAKDAEIARIANNPAEIADKPGMRANYVKPTTPPINPETGKSWMGSSGYNYLASQIGHDEAIKAWKARYGENNVPFKQVQDDYAAARKTAGSLPGEKGGAFGTPKYIPNYIKGGVNPAVFAEGAQKIANSAVGQGVANTVKGGAAMLPFALATDVKQQNVGYRRELEQEIKKAKSPERKIQLQSEIQKLDDDLYLKAMQRRFIDKNIPAALRK